MVVEIAARMKKARITEDLANEGPKHVLVLKRRLSQVLHREIACNEIAANKFPDATVACHQGRIRHRAECQGWRAWAVI